MDARIDQVLADLSVYERRIGLPVMPTNADSEVTRWFNATRTMLRGLSAEEAAEIAVLVMQYAFHLQRQVNEQQTLAEILDRAISSVTDRAQKHELQVKRIAARARLTRISYLAAKVETLARKYETLVTTKRKQHG